MGRPIKFRAWDSENKTLFYESNLIFLTIDGRPHFWTGDDCLIQGKIWPEYLKLQQFTGLLDRNNKEIYEGDIVTYQAGEPNKNDGSFYRGKSVVEFENGAFWPRPIKEECEDSWYDYELKDLEVIGNIFENPELLK